MTTSEFMRLATRALAHPLLEPQDALRLQAYCDSQTVSDSAADFVLRVLRGLGKADAYRGEDGRSPPLGTR
jgi:hypothetical protein